LYEKADRPGGLLVYGIPDFKLNKELIARRVEQMIGEGVEFVTDCCVGTDITFEALRKQFDAICIAIGSKVPRDLPIEGRGLSGVHFAVDFLEQQNRRNAGQIIDDAVSLLATGKNVVVVGGGDTGSDCIGTSHRQGALSVTNFEIMPKPPETRSPTTPWPAWPYMLRTSSSHEEGGTRDFGVMTERFAGKDGKVTEVHCVRVNFEKGQFVKQAGTEFIVPADLVLLAMGFVSPEPKGLLSQLGAELDKRGNLKIDHNAMTSVPGVFAAGDCQRGQSLVVWAISDGRRAASGIDRYLMTPPTEL
jgi:glutamate synthase (NADPH/NADH) small chain